MGSYWVVPPMRIIGITPVLEAKFDSKFIENRFGWVEFPISEYEIQHL
jgi:hypothetical protein